MGRKHCGEKVKLLITSNFSFSHSVFKRLVLQTRKNQGLFWKGLISNRNILYGVFYRPPNAGASYLSLIEDSIALARDTDISDLIVTGDFNLNTCNYTQSRKIESICSQFDLTQCVDEPTHFTENSASTIDLLFVSNKSSILTTGAS